MATVAVLPIMEHNPSIFDVLENSWSSQCVLSPDRTSGTAAEGGNAYTQDLLGSGYSLRRHVQSDGGEGSTASSSRDDTLGDGNVSGLRWCHSVDEAELKAMFSTFDENADGFICGKELRRFTNIFGIEISDADAESMIASVVGARIEGGGRIDFQKFCCLFRTHLVGQKCSAAEEQEREQEDSDSLADAFKVFDKNGDGQISAEELKDVLLGLGMPAGRSLKQCKKIIQKVDCDGNGQCDISEFKKMMTSRSL